MEKLQEESRMKLPSLRQATDEDCRLMFQLQRLDGKESDEENQEQTAEYEVYKDEFDPSKIEVIELKGVPVGRLRVVREDDIYIGGFQILPEYRGLGIGTSVLSDLIEESEQTGMVITLEVFTDNTSAIQLYQKLGFKITAETEKQQIMKYEPQSA